MPNKDIFQKAAELDSSTDQVGIGIDTLAIAGAMGAGAAAGYAAVYPWSLRNIDLSRYPRLQKMRQVGERGGFRVLSSAMGSAVEASENMNFATRFDRTIGQILFSPLHPIRRISQLPNKFSGVLYVREGQFAEHLRPLKPMVVNWGSWDIGVNKLDTWRYFQEKGIADLHAKSIAATEFYSGRGSKAQLSQVGRAFIEEAGGLHNLVVKRPESALGQGVWTDATKLPSSVAEEMLRHPDRFMLQQKMNLAAEFRVVTVGGKSVYQAHRFGTPGVRRFAEGLRSKISGVPIIGKMLWNENIQPIVNRETRMRLAAFAEQVAKEMPYDIGAFDIGLTKGGKFQVIEAQRHFGSISNPIVSRRIKYAITGKTGYIGLLGAAIGALAFGGGLSLFSGSDDAYNTIEGFTEKGEASRLRKANTDFGSGYQDSFVSQLLSIEVDQSKTGPAALRARLEAFARQQGYIFHTGSSSRQQQLYRRLLNKPSAKPTKLLGVVKKHGAIHVVAPTKLLEQKFAEQYSSYIGRPISQDLASRMALVAQTHEMAEAFYGSRTGMVQAFGTHVSPKVLQAEMEVASLLGTKTYEEFINIRQIEADILRKKGKNLSYVSALEDMLQNERLSLARMKQVDYIGKLHRIASEGEFFFPESYYVGPKEIGAAISSGDIAWHNFLDSKQKFIKSGVSKVTARLSTKSPYSRGTIAKYLLIGAASAWMLSLFSGEDDQYNTIEGLNHLGFAAEQRRILTDFGSGFDKVRQMAKSMGVSFEDIISSRSFQQALEQAREVRFIGSGKFAETYLMEAQYGKEVLQFVRKRVVMTEAQLRREAANPEKYLRSLDLRHEAEMMSALGETMTVPSVYTSKAKEMFMEYMPGKQLGDYIEAGIELPASVKEALFETIEQAARKGRINLDIHHGNILYDPISQRVSWIDWGQAEPITRDIHSAIAMMQEKVAQSITPLSASAPSKTVLRRKLHNVVPEGLSHGGMAASKRRQTTDFSSPWKGLFGGISRRVSKFLGKEAIPGTAKLLDPRKAAKMAQSSSLEDFASLLRNYGGFRTIGLKPNEKELFESIAQHHPSIRSGGASFLSHKQSAKQGIIAFNPDRIRQAGYELAQTRGIDSTLAKEVIESDNFLKTILYHEHLEGQAVVRFGKEALMKSNGINHQAGQVILGEAGFIESLKDAKLKEFFRAIRNTKIESPTFEAGLEAFKEGNSASVLRKLITDFGSGYRGLLSSTSKEITRRTLKDRRGRRNLVNSSNDLKKAQKCIWENATYGGKGHIRRSKGHVKQLSRFGGGL